jgi:hypothetical protein
MCGENQIKLVVAIASNVFNKKTFFSLRLSSNKFRNPTQNLNKLLEFPLGAAITKDKKRRIME